MSSWSRRIGSTIDAIAHGLEQIAMTLAPYVEPAFHAKIKRGLHRFVEGLERGLK